MTSKSWTKRFIVPPLAILTIFFVTNYTINPYNIFAYSYQGRYNAFKPYSPSDRMTKFYEAIHLKPATLIMGTSRIGFFNHTNLLPYAPQPIYNMAMAGASIDEETQYLEYMITHHKLKMVVWQLDFFSFNPDKEPQTTFTSERLQKTFYLNDYIDALLKYQTFEKSIKTIKKNFSDDYTLQLIRPNFEEGQYLTQQGFIYDKKTIQSNIFRTLNEYRTSPIFLKSSSFKNPISINTNLDKVRKIVQLCHEKNIKCIILTSPVYAKHLDLIHELDLWNTFEYWKQSLADIQPYYDFCTYNSVSYNLMNFRDSAHLASPFGPVVFGRIFNTTTVEIPKDFGVWITNENIHDFLNQQRSLINSIDSLPLQERL